jgi:hypothetical protein
VALDGQPAMAVTDSGVPFLVGPVWLGVYGTGPGPITVDFDDIIVRDASAPAAIALAAGIVRRLDAAIPDPNILAAVRIDAIGVSVQNGDAPDVHDVAAQEADVVVRRVDDGQVANNDIATPRQRDRLGTASARPVAVDLARAENADLRQVESLQERKAEVTGFGIRERLVAKLFDRIEIRVVGADDQGGAGIEAQGEATSQVQAAQEIVPRGEVDRPTRLCGRVDGRLNAASVLRPAVALCAVVAHVKLRAALGDPQRSSGEDRRHRQSNGSP